MGLKVFLRIDFIGTTVISVCAFLFQFNLYMLHLFLCDGISTKKYFILAPS